MKKVKSLYMSAYLAEEKKVAWSIFYRVGGHMNDVMGADSINEVLRVNAQRELEEVGLAKDSQNMEYLGFITMIIMK